VKVVLEKCPGTKVYLCTEIKIKIKIKTQHKIITTKKKVFTEQFIYLLTVGFF